MTKQDQAGSAMRWMRRLAFGLLLACPAGATFAATCEPVSPEVSRLKRQIAANLSFEAKYGCVTGGETFACRELTRRIAGIRSALSRLSPAPACTVAARVAARPERKIPAVRVKRPAMPQESAALVAATPKIQTMCVRPSDGYYFPTPQSGFVPVEAAPILAAQCRSMCDDPDMDVFKVDPATLEADDMLSLTTGARYADLPNAGKYRHARTSNACDMRRLPVTAEKAMPSTVVAAMEPEVAGPLFTDVALRGSRTVVPVMPRKIRIVGAAYLPEN